MLEMATMMMTIVVFLLTSNVADGFPSISYTGKSCTPAPAQAAKRCPGDKTALVFSSNMQDASNGTHAFVFLGEPFELTCCTPPKSNSSTDIDAVLSQREISYTLHTGSPSAELSVMKGKNKMETNLVTYGLEGSYSSCEYTTVSRPKATYSEAGKWTCSAFDGTKAELEIVVGEIGQLSTEFVDNENSPTGYASFTLDGYSPAGAKLELQVGTSHSNLSLLTPTGVYGGGSISITGFKSSADQTDCKTTKNKYDAIAGGNYSMRACRYKTTTTFNVTRSMMGTETIDLCTELTVQIGPRRPFSTTSKFLLSYRATSTIAASSASPTIASTKALPASTSHRIEGCLWLAFAYALFVTVATTLQG